MKALSPRRVREGFLGVASELCTPNAFTEPTGAVLGTPQNVKYVWSACVRRSEAWRDPHRPWPQMLSPQRPSEATHCWLFRWLQIFPRENCEVPWTLCVCTSFVHFPQQRSFTIAGVLPPSLLLLLWTCWPCMCLAIFLLLDSVSERA